MLKRNMLDQDYELIGKSKKKARGKKGPQNLHLKDVQPMTEAQHRFFENYHRSDIMVLHGYAGTGKTYIAIYNALKQLLSNDNADEVIICRSAVPSRDIGFLPGTEQDKMKVYELPYRVMVNDMIGRGDAYECLKAKDHIQFMSTSFIRGITLENKVVVVDEMQNMTFEELDTLITRMGRNSKIIFCGDFRQSDLKRREQDGLDSFLDILELIPEVAMIEFEIDDVVRSGLVKKYLLAKDQVL